MPAWLAQLLLVLGVGLAIVVVVLILVAIVRSMRTDVPDAGRGGTGPDETGLPLWARGDPGDARALEAAGRFAEAIHALLLHALRSGIGRSGRRFSDALTAREVVSGLGLPAGRRGALTRLLRASEDAWFGGKPAEAADFRRCLDLYREAVGAEDA